MEDDGGRYIISSKVECDGIITEPMHLMEKKFSVLLEVMLHLEEKCY